MINCLKYNPKLKDYAKILRKQGVLSEVILWKYLKEYKKRGLDFHRQKPIDNYIVDFYCSQLNLVIEIDGVSHAYKMEYDQMREKKLISLGLAVLHFSDSIVKKDINSVLYGIEGWISDYVAQHTPPVGHPSQEGNLGVA